jgi:hypothetical protein
MSQLTFLRYKYCACCDIRLDQTKKIHLRRVNESEVSAINTAKPIILSNKRKAIDTTLIKVGDYICANCRQYSKKFKPDSAGSINTLASQLYPTLPNIDEEPTISPSTTYTLTTTASTSYNTRASTSALNTPSTSYNTKASSGTSSMEFADDEINHVTLKIPRTI